MMTALEAVLSAMASDRMWCENSGDSEAPTGHFARVGIYEGDMPEVLSAFHDVIEAYGMADTNELLGYWLVVTNSQGFVDITAFDNDAALIAAYEQLESAYDEWADESGDND